MFGGWGFQGAAFFEQFLVHFKGMIFRAVLAVVKNRFRGTGASAPQTGLGIYGVAMAFEFSVFFEEHFDTQSRNTQRNGCKSKGKNHKKLFHNDNKKATLVCGLAPQAGLEPATP